MLKNNLKILYIGMCTSTNIKNGVYRAFSKYCSVYKELNCGEIDLNKKAIHLVQQFKPNIIFMQIQAGDIIEIATVQEFRKHGAYIMNWTGDIRSDVPQWMIDLAPYIDTSLFTNMRDVREMQNKNLNADYLEIGYDETIYCPEGDIIQSKPIVYFGNNYGSGKFELSQFRIEMVDFLRHHFGNKIGIYGNNWQQDNVNFMSNQYDECAAYRSAVIAINVSHYEVEKYSSDRMLRILGTGKPICLAKYYPAIESVYQDNVHLRVWHTLTELKELCEYYLDSKNDNERKQIATNGMQYVQKTFTFNNMIKNLIKIYEKA